jgi:large subunit ribosomal protein L21
MYAIIQEGGRQFKVTSGDILRIDRQVEAGVKDVTFSEVLFVGGEGTPKIGKPIVAGATVTADVIGPVKGPKVLNVRYRRRKGFHKTVGHRQKYLAVKVTGINV